jgi:hypothetical protein
MRRKLLGPCQQSVSLARLCREAKQVSWDHGRKKPVSSRWCAKKRSYVKFQNPDFHT